MPDGSPGVFHNVGSPILNERGQIAFENYPDGSIHEESRSLWVWQPDGAYQAIVAPGDLIELVPGDAAGFPAS